MGSLCGGIAAATCDLRVNGSDVVCLVCRWDGPATLFLEAYCCGLVLAVDEATLSSSTAPAAVKAALVATSTTSGGEEEEAQALVRSLHTALAHRRMQMHGLGRAPTACHSTLPWRFHQFAAESLEAQMYRATVVAASL